MNETASSVDVIALDSCETRCFFEACASEEVRSSTMSYVPCESGVGVDVPCGDGRSVRGAGVSVPSGCASQAVAGPCVAVTRSGAGVGVPWGSLSPTVVDIEGLESGFAPPCVCSIAAAVESEVAPGSPRWAALEISAESIGTKVCSGVGPSKADEVREATSASKAVGKRRGFLCGRSLEDPP